MFKNSNFLYFCKKKKFVKNFLVICFRINTFFELIVSQIKCVLEKKEIRKKTLIFYLHNLRVIARIIAKILICAHLTESVNH